MHVLRLGLGNERAVSAFVTVCKFGRSLIRRENIRANSQVFVHMAVSGNTNITTALKNEHVNPKLSDYRTVALKFSANVGPCG